MGRNAMSRVLQSTVVAVLVLGGCAKLAGVAGDYYEESSQCQSAVPPGPPATKDGGGDIEIVIALHTLDFHENGDFRSIGFDLDKACTCDGQNPTCAFPSDSRPEHRCDGPAGRDNNAATVIKDNSILGLSSAEFNEAIAQGEWSMLARIRGYNGLPDDDRVSVAWLVPVTKPPADPPKWDGTDVWGIQGSCLNHKAGQPDLEDPQIIDDHAYVTGGRLVASLQHDAPLYVMGYFAIVIKNTFFVGTLTRKGSLWTIDDGVMAGMWSSKQFLASLADAKPSGVPVCMDHPFYAGIKQSICRARDMPSGTLLATDPCEAISVAFTFTGVSVVAPVVAWDAPTPPKSCDAGVDPATDKCD